MELLHIQPLGIGFFSMQNNFLEIYPYYMCINSSSGLSSVVWMAHCLLKRFQILDSFQLEDTLIKLLCLSVY